MTSRLHRVHGILRAANVPCALDTKPGLGLVLLAGVPDTGAWDVLVADTSSGLLVQDGRGTTRVPSGVSDAAVADTVKVHVVRAWADQGDTDAKALIATLDGTGRLPEEPVRVDVGVPALDVLALLNPLHIAGRMLDAANQLGSIFLAPQLTTVEYRMWSPWGTIRGRYTRL
ncbi:MAG: hypothetical protein ABWZ98_07785 [Nakamurella sp.]